MQVDALIIGAGPAGTSCALGLAMRGCRVVIIDKSVFPRNKTCGGFIGPESMAMMIDFEIWPRLLKEGACVVEESVLTSSRGASTAIPIEGIALGVSRKLLDKLLLDSAKVMGVEVYEGAQVRNIYNNSTGFDVTVDHYLVNKVFNLRACHVIDASGQHAPSSNLGRVQLGLAAMYENIPQASGRVMLHCCQGGHVGINSFENNQVNVCYVVDSEYFKTKGNNAQKVITDWIKESSHLQRVLIGAKRVSEWKAIYIPVRNSIVLYENGIWRVGNSAAFIDTAIGVGISVALQSGQLLAQSITGYSHDVERLKFYTLEYQRCFSGQRRLASLFGNLIHYPWAAEMIIRLLDANYTMRRKVMNYSRPGFEVEGRMDYTKSQFFNMGVKKGVFSEV